MQLTINGRRRDFTTPLTINQLLQQLELPPERVVVELNREILALGAQADRPLQDGDILELIQFVGGG